MATTNPTAALGDMTRFAEMRKRLWFLLGALVVYRMGTFIPVPGIDAARFAAFFSTQSGTLLGMFNMFSGGALSLDAAAAGLALARRRAAPDAQSRALGTRSRLDGV